MQQGKHKDMLHPLVAGKNSAGPFIREALNLIQEGLTIFNPSRI